MYAGGSSVILRSGVDSQNEEAPKSDMRAVPTISTRIFTYIIANIEYAFFLRFQNRPHHTTYGFQIAMDNSNTFKVM